MIRTLCIGAFIALVQSGLALAQAMPNQAPVGPAAPASSPVEAPSAPPSAPVVGGHPDSVQHPMTPAEIQAAERLNAQVAQKYMESQQASQPAQVTAPPASKPRTGIKPPPTTIEIKPGVNVVFGIAQGHLNRLVTPFRNPVVKTTSVAATSIEKNIVYVSTSTSEPVGFFIHDAGDPDKAISVTMVPADIPPISVKLDLPGYTPNSDGGANAEAADPKLAQGWETGTPYVDSITQTFRALAKGKIPDGYSFTPLKGQTSLMPGCGVSGLRIEPLQLMSGYDMQVIVSRVVNFTDYPRDIDDKACGGDSFMALAAWPVYSVPPHGTTELYVAVRRQEQPGDDARPSVLGPGVH